LRNHCSIILIKNYWSWCFL